MNFIKSFSTFGTYCFIYGATFCYTNHVLNETLRKNTKEIREGFEITPEIRVSNISGLSFEYQLHERSKSKQNSFLDTIISM